MVRVRRVEDGGIAQELGIVPGTELLTVNGRELADFLRSEEHTSELQSHVNLVCRLLLDM